MNNLFNLYKDRLFRLHHRLYRINHNNRLVEIEALHRLIKHLQEPNCQIVPRVNKLFVVLSLALWAKSGVRIISCARILDAALIYTKWGSSKKAASCTAIEISKQTWQALVTNATIKSPA